MKYELNNESQTTNYEPRTGGFSLAEVLMAISVLAVGMLLVAGVFPVAVHFTNTTIEQTTAAVVADEAFAKIRLYGISFNPPFLPNPFIPNTDPNLNCIDFGSITPILTPFNTSDYQYPSTNLPITKQYSWSALCRLIDTPSRTVQVTVFVCRKLGTAAVYRNPIDPSTALPYPMPVEVLVQTTGILGELQIIDAIGYETFINDGYHIIDNETGRIYRVLERYKPPNDTIIRLDRPWVPPASPNPPSVWVVPPSFSGGRGPCVGVFQKIINFRIF